MAGIESDADLSAFFQPSEFADEAILRCYSGDSPITGNVAVFADLERPGENSNSSASAFLAAAADVTIQRIQFITPLPGVAHARPEDILIITTGRHAGEYRVVTLQRYGAMMRITLNEL